MVDCKALDLTKGSTAQTIPGIYETVKQAMETGKAILACNCLWGDKTVTPISCFSLQWDESTIIVTASTLQVHITNADSITIVNIGKK